MTPFSKIVGVFAALAAIFTAADHSLIVSLVGTGGAAIVTTICTIITLLSHALSGNGPATPATNTPANQPVAPTT